MTVAVPAELGDDPPHQPVDEPGEAVEDPALQHLDGVLADGLPGRDQLDLAQLRGPGGERLDRDLDAGGERAAEELALRADDVEVGARAEVDDDDGPAVQVVGGEGVDERGRRRPRAGCRRAAARRCARPARR